MILNFIGSFGALGTAVLALVMGLGLIATLMFSDGRPTDLKANWQGFAIIGLVLFALLFLIGRALDKPRDVSCDQPNLPRCIR